MCVRDMDHNGLSAKRQGFHWKIDCVMDCKDFAAVDSFFLFLHTI